MNAHAEWIELSQDDLVDDVKKGSSGISIHMVLSQYDRPREARAHIEKRSGGVIVEFRYLSSEATKNIPISERIVASIGRNSNRVYALRISGPFNGAEQFKVDVDSALDRLGRTVSHGKALHSRSYAAARKAIDENFLSFVPQLASS